MFLIAGLGNPGQVYAETRHNLGFMVVDRIAERAGLSWRRVGLSMTGFARLNEFEVVLAKPQTFMNRSGLALQQLLQHYQVKPPRALVVFDDAALAFGKIRIRRSGGSGGQKGIKSVIDILGRQDFPRLRIGIAQQQPATDLSGFVLSDFDRSEKLELPALIERAENAARCWLSQGVEQAMSQFN